MAQDATVPKGERNGRNDSIGLLAAGCLLVWFLAVGWWSFTDFHLEAAMITGIFAVAGYLSRGVSISGAAAGWVVAFILYAIGGWRLFGVLFLVFALTWTATRLGKQRKESLGLAEPIRGRGANQVMANLGVGAACLFSFHVSDVLKPYFSWPILAPTIAVLCEAAADTVSSEIGQGFSKRARLITDLSVVVPGTNGGLSLVGTIAGIAAAVGIGLAVHFAIPLLYQQVWLAVVAGVAGMFVDSLLGATLERRGYLNNDAVNLLGTASAAGLALLLTANY